MVAHYVAPHAVILSSTSFFSFFYIKVTVALVMEAEKSSCHFILLQLNIVFRILFSNTLSLCSFLDVRDQDYIHTKQLTALWFLYILTFTFLDSRQEDKTL
jgi:hypothetical protein